MDRNQDYIVIPEGAVKRHVIWRVIRLIAYFITLGIATETFRAPIFAHGPDVIMAEMVPTIFTLLVCHFVLNFIYKRIAFRWIFEFPYSKQNIAYLKQAKTFKDQNL